MQDAFLKVWERWDRVGRMDDPVGYLYRTAMNLFRKRYRRAMLAVRRTVGLTPANDDFSEADDVGLPMLLPGGEIGRLLRFEHDDDLGRWTYALEFRGART